MANKFLDDNGLLYFWQKIVNKFATKEEIANAGGGDMLKSVYDTDNNGKVDKADDADKLGGHSPDYYATTSQVGQANGIASLGADGKVPTSQLPETAPPEHTHEMSDINGLVEASNKAVEDLTAIATGKCASYVFNTVDELDVELAKSEFTAKLKTGDVFLIRAVDVPDYWWDETTNSKQILETTKVDLTTITNAEIDTIVAS